MAIDNNIRTRAAAFFSDIYTCLLGLAFAAVFSTAVFMTVKSYLDYGVIFGIARP